MQNQATDHNSTVALQHREVVGGPHLPFTQSLKNTSPHIKGEGVGTQALFLYLRGLSFIPGTEQEPRQMLFNHSLLVLMEPALS